MAEKEVDRWSATARSQATSVAAAQQEMDANTEQLQAALQESDTAAEAEARLAKDLDGCSAVVDALQTELQQALAQEAELQRVSGRLPGSRFFCIV